MLNSPKTNILTYGLIERTSSVLDEIASKNVQKDKDNDQLRKKNTANKQKPTQNTNENPKFSKNTSYAKRILSFI